MRSVLLVDFSKMGGDDSSQQMILEYCFLQGNKYGPGNNGRYRYGETNGKTVQRDLKRKHALGARQSSKRIRKQMHDADAKRNYRNSHSFTTRIRIVVSSW